MNIVLMIINYLFNKVKRKMHLFQIFIETQKDVILSGIPDNRA